MNNRQLYKVGSTRPLVKVEVADRFLARLKGLLGRESLGQGDALLLTRCSAVHTFGMRFPIDVVFLDQAGRVKCIANDVRPWRWVGETSASSVLELAAGGACRLALSVGDQLSLETE